MNGLKPLFITLYSIGAIIGAVHSGIMLILTGTNSAWLGAFTATAPIALFFIRLLSKKNIARTPENLPLILLPAMGGFICSMGLTPAGLFPTVYAAGIGAVCSLLYIFWYSPTYADTCFAFLKDFAEDKLVSSIVIILPIPKVISYNLWFSLMTGLLFI